MVGLVNHGPSGDDQKKLIADLAKTTIKWPHISSDLNVTVKSMTVGELMHMDQDEKDRRDRAGTAYAELAQPLEQMKRVVEALTERSPSDEMDEKLAHIKERLEQDSVLLKRFADSLRRIHGGFQNNDAEFVMKTYIDGLNKRRQAFSTLIDSLRADVENFSDVGERGEALKSIAGMISSSSALMAETLQTVKVTIDRAFPEQSPGLPSL